MQTSHISGWFELLHLNPGAHVPAHPSQVYGPDYHMVGSPVPLAEFEYPLDVLIMFANIKTVKQCLLPRRLMEGDVVNMIVKNPWRIRTMVVVSKKTCKAFLYPGHVLMGRPPSRLMLVTLEKRFNSFRQF